MKNLFQNFLSYILDLMFCNTLFESKNTFPTSDPKNIKKTKM